MDISRGKHGWKNGCDLLSEVVMVPLHKNGTAETMTDCRIRV